MTRQVDNSLNLKSLQFDMLQKIGLIWEIVIWLSLNISLKRQNYEKRHFVEIEKLIKMTKFENCLCWSVCLSGHIILEVLRLNNELKLNYSCGRIVLKPKSSFSWGKMAMSKATFTLPLWTYEEQFTDKDRYLRDEITLWKNVLFGILFYFQITL